MSNPSALRVAVIAEGSVWGGIETHLCHLLGSVDWRVHGVEPSAWLLHGGALEETLRESTPGRVERAKQPGRLAALGWLRREFEQLRPHVIHAHGFVPEMLGALLAGRMTQRRLIATVHSDPGSAKWAAPGRTRLAASLLFGSRWLRTRQIIAVSADIRDRLIALGIAPTRISLVYNGVPPPDPNERAIAAETRHSFGVAPDAIVAGMFGRLERVKGHARVLRVLDALRNTVPGLIVVVAGDGPLRDEIAAEIQRLGLGERVRCIGFRRDAPALMSAVDIGLFASDHEGIPFAALEMMARGVPLVCFGVGGLREIVHNGETGVLVPPYDESVFAQSLATLAADPIRRKRLGRNAARVIETSYSTAAMASATARIWRSVALDRGHPKAAVDHGTSVG